MSLRVNWRALIYTIKRTDSGLRASAAQSCTINVSGPPAKCGSHFPRAVQTSFEVAGSFKISANYSHGDGVCSRAGGRGSRVTFAAARTWPNHTWHWPFFRAGSRPLRRSGRVRAMPRRYRLYVSKDRDGTIVPEGPVRERSGRGQLLLLQPGEALLSCSFGQLF